MARLTMTEVAAAVGVHKSTVSRQARAAGIVGADGKVDLDEYRAMRDGLDPGLQTTGRAAAAVKPGSQLADERLLKLQIERKQKQYALAKQLGEMMDTPSIDAAAANVFGRAIQAFLDMASPLSVRLAVMTDPGAIAEAVQAATKEVMGRLHREFLEDAARRSAEAG
jgi:DNA-binding MurR/RpiR family transcriptional regulator